MWYFVSLALIYCDGVLVTSDVVRDEFHIFRLKSNQTKIFLLQIDRYSIIVHTVNLISFLISNYQYMAALSLDEPARMARSRSYTECLLPIF